MYLYNRKNLEDWRENFKGLEYIDNELGLTFTGAVDDLWLNLDTNRVVVVDYKQPQKQDLLKYLILGGGHLIKGRLNFIQFLLLKTILKLKLFIFPLAKWIEGRAF